MRVRNILALAAMVSAGWASAAWAAAYDFLSVTSTGPASSRFTSANGNGFIDVSHVFSAGGAGPQDNVNSAINPSQFTTLFPGTGLVQGHVAQTVYAHTSTVTFDLTGYALSSSTMFGIWNITDEVAYSPTAPVYRVVLIDAANTPQAPVTLTLLGNEDNESQVSGRRQLLLNTATGDLSPGALINASGIHTDAAFYYNIPATTKSIIVQGDLPALNNIGDGVGYYFAELAVPEPSAATAALTAAGVAGVRRRRRTAD